MTHDEIGVTWIVADPGTDQVEVEAWGRSVDDVRAHVLVQVATGRGRLVGGRGAIVVAAGPGARSMSRPDWCVDLIEARFRLRQVHAPGEQPDLRATPAMLLTRTYVPGEMRDEFRDWLEREHSQRQLDVPGNNWYLGYEEIGAGHSFMNFWGIDDPSVADGLVWDRQRLTPWRERMVPAMDGMDRGFYRPVSADRD